jgi:DNA-binding CsgD family transcriptional regulator
MPATINTALIDYTFHANDILEVRYNPDLSLITRKIVRKMVEDRRHFLPPERSRYLLVHVLPSSSLAWHYLSDAIRLSGLKGIAVLSEDWAAGFEHTIAMIRNSGIPVGVFHGLEEAQSWLSALAMGRTPNRDDFEEYYNPLPPLRAKADTLPSKEFVTIDDVRAFIDKALSVDRNEKERSMLAAARRALLYVADMVDFSLTPIERDIIECLVSGMTTRSIAAYQKKSPRTVEIQKQILYRKVGVASAAELIKKINDLGLLKGPGLA